MFSFVRYIDEGIDVGYFVFYLFKNNTFIYKRFVLEKNVCFDGLL